MVEVKELLAYLLIEYPEKLRDMLSKTRVTKLIYLCDWKHSIEYEKQITNIEWVFDNYGPFVWDVMDVVNSNPDLFTIHTSQTFYGSEKQTISIINESYSPKLELSEKKTADFVINATKSLNFDQFLKLVYSTYPIMTCERYSKLNLPKLAKLYKSTAIYRKITPDIVSY